MNCDFVALHFMLVSFECKSVLISSENHAHVETQDGNSGKRNHQL